VEKVRRNLRLLRRELTGRQTFSIPPYTKHQVIASIDMFIAELERQISDEVDAERTYRKLSEEPVIKEYDVVRGMLRSIADDEKRHYGMLRDIIYMLRGI